MAAPCRSPETVGAAARHILLHPGDVFLRRWNWKAALLSSVFRSIAFAVPMTRLAPHDALRAICIEASLCIAIGGFWGSLLQAMRGARPVWLASLWAAVILPAAFHCAEYGVLRAGNVVHVKTGVVVSVIVTIGSLLINFGLMRRGLLITGEHSGSLGQDFRQIPGALASMARGLSMRTFLQVLASAPLLPRKSRAAKSNPQGRVAWNPDLVPRLSLEREYRADAQVLVLGLPVMNRQNVGCARVLWQEFEGEDFYRLLEFSGHSTPERAAGIHRLGLMREVAGGTGNGGIESLYFGVANTSGRQAMDAPPEPSHAKAWERVFSAIEGRISDGVAESVTALFLGPEGIGGSDKEEFAGLARNALNTAGKGTVKSGLRGCQCSFLQTLALLLMRRNTEEHPYFYSGRIYRLRLARAFDSKATAHFRERKIIGTAADVIRVHGRVQREEGGPETEFRIWVTAGERPLPLRIEYQPAPHLRLQFHFTG